VAPVEGGGRGALPGALIAGLGVLCLIGGAVSPWPDALGGWIFGGVLLVAAYTSLRRRGPKPSGP
jgi:hypothetical protein